MTALATKLKSELGTFRAKLLTAMTLVVLAITAAGLSVAQHKVALETEHDLQQDFRSALASLHGVQEVRHAALGERCRALVRRPRIHAALEDDALDLLYPSARDEMRDVMEVEADEPGAEAPAYTLHAKFYRFLDAQGAVIPPPDARDTGALEPGEEAQLSLPGAPDRQQLGYLLREQDDTHTSIDEIIAMPIASTETGDVIAATVLGFQPADLGGQRAGVSMKSGIWLDGRLHLQNLTASARATLTGALTRALESGQRVEHSVGLPIDGVPHHLFYKQLNPGSLYPPAYEVCVYPLTELLVRQQHLRWQAAGACALLLLGGLVVSNFLATRLSTPVEKLAFDSEINRTQRQRAEAALEATHEELQRAARFSADASHQLKTPVTVLRAGLDELLAEGRFTPETQEEISALVQQTCRLNGIIEDLLLLSRMDAGRLQIDFRPVNVTHLIEAWQDDLSALPDPFGLTVETDLNAGLTVAGEQRYLAVILQNLLENARKYNRPRGRIRIAARRSEDGVLIAIGNTGPTISPAAQEHIFERFHRGSVGENVPGYGLGLNLARELTRLHRGDLRLLRSEADWTEFEVRFCLAKPRTVDDLGGA